MNEQLFTVPGSRCFGLNEDSSGYHCIKQDTTVDKVAIDHQQFNCVAIIKRTEELKRERFLTKM
jgi:hypothetical protein